MALAPSKNAVEMLVSEVVPTASGLRRPIEQRLDPIVSGVRIAIYCSWAQEVDIERLSVCLARHNGGPSSFSGLPDESFQSYGPYPPDFPSGSGCEAAVPDPLGSCDGARARADNWHRVATERSQRHWRPWRLLCSLPRARRFGGSSRPHSPSRSHEYASCREDWSISAMD
jgi:hypothetical protein